MHHMQSAIVDVTLSDPHSHFHSSSSSSSSFVCSQTQQQSTEYCIKLYSSGPPRSPEGAPASRTPPRPSAPHHTSDLSARSRPDDAPPPEPPRGRRIRAAGGRKSGLGDEDSLRSGSGCTRSECRESRGPPHPPRPRSPACSPSPSPPRAGSQPTRHSLLFSLLPTSVRSSHILRISSFSAADSVRTFRAGIPAQTSPLPTVLRGVTTEPGAIAAPSQM